MVKLFELNLINIDAVEKYSAGFLPNIEFEPARKWFQKSVRNLLINDEQFNTRIAQVSPTAPDWMKQRYKENVPLYRFSPSGDLTNKLSHIVDWLNSVYQVSQEKVAPNAPKAAARQQLVVYATKLLNSVNSIDLKTLISPRAENVKHHVEDWFDTLNKFVSVTGDHQATTSEDMQHVIDYDNGAWVELKSDKSLGIEGKLMGHCVGGYGNRVRGGETRIFSLRDNNSMPHVTIEVTNGQVVQVKGKSNKPPVKKYVQYVQDFLNKMQFPPTGGNSHYGSGARDIRQIGLLYNPETKTYGTLKEVAKVVYTTPDGYQILTVDQTESGEKPEYFLWKDDSQCATIRETYSNSFKIDLNEDRDTEHQPPSEENRKFYAECMDFLNSAFQKFDLQDTDRYGFYKVPNDEKWYDINQIPAAKEFTSNITAKEVQGSRGDSKEYIFLMPGLAPVEGQRNYSSILFELHGQGRINYEHSYRDAQIDKPVFEKEFAAFLNEIDYKNTMGSSGYYNNYDSLLHFNIVLTGTGEGDDAKIFKTFSEAAEVVANLGTAKIARVSTPVSSEVLYRLYEKNPDAVIAQWKMSSSSAYTSSALKDIKVMNDSFRKYVKLFVNYLNENSITLRNGNKDIKNYLKEWGINKRGEKWFTGKSTGLDSDGDGTYRWTFEKVGKLGNVVTPDGKRVGKVKFSEAKHADDISTTMSYGEDEKEENKKLTKDMLSFLTDYFKKNNITISNNALPGNAKNLGFCVDASGAGYQLARIEDLYPSEDISTVDDMTWKKKAMVTGDDNPTQGYKYGLYKGNELLIKVSSDQNNKKEIDKITIRNPAFNPEEDNYNNNNNKILPFNETNVAPYVSALSDLFKKEGLTAKGGFLTSVGLQLRDGTLQTVTDDPKTRGFVNGLIQYEDGTSWKRNHRSRDEWTLEAEPVEGRDRHSRTILTCKVTDDGITRIDVVDGDARKKPSSYRGFLNDMLDIVEQMNANE